MSDERDENNPHRPPGRGETPRLDPDSREHLEMLREHTARGGATTVDDAGPRDSTHAREAQARAARELEERE